jgi:hypothetical protein
MVTWTSQVGTPAAVGIKASARVESRANAPAGTCANVAEPWCIITLTGTQPWDSVVVTATASNTYGTSAPISAPSFRVYSTPGAPFFLGVTPQDRKIDVVVGSIWHRQRSSPTEDTFLSDAERIASLCILITPIDDPDEVAHQLCQSKAAFEAFWGGGSGFYSFPRLENDRAYSVLLVGTNPAGTVTTASEVVIPGTDPAPPASPTNVKWTRQANGNVLVWWKPVPRSSWNSQLPPRNVVRIGAQSWTVGGQTSQLLIAKSELLKPPAEGSALSVIAANRAGDSAPAVGSPVTP